MGRSWKMLKELVVVVCVWEFFHMLLGFGVFV